MMRMLSVAAVGLVLAACGTPGSGQSAAPATAQATPVPTPIPVVNVDDMMGLYPQQTVLVAATDHLSAVTLLNHFTRYTIATQGVAQVTTEGTGQFVYLLEGGTNGSRRLRAFDLGSGSERAVHDGIADVAAERRVLSATNDGRVLVLKGDARHAWVDAYDGRSLRPLGAVTDKPGCGDRLLASGSRVAIVCLATGEIAVDNLRGNHASIDGALVNLVAAAMADDGALYLATADQQLASVAAGATKLARISWPSEWSGTILADGLAVANGSGYAVVAQHAADGAWLRVFAISDVAQRRSFRLAGTPLGGVLALWPFGYYTVDGTVRHVDLTSGVLETMAEVGDGAIPGAVVNG